MAINLLSIQPHKVSRDLSGYITFLYGPPKCGKTTFGSRMPGHLLLAFEQGYNALPGVMAQPVTTWGELKQIVRELKKPEVKAVYQSIIIDTADIAADACQKYICNQLGIENIGDGGWTNNGWAKYKKEFEETFRTLTQLGYAVVFLSHVKEKTIKSEGGAEYTQIGSSMQSSALAVIENMSDIIGYAHTKVDSDGVGKVVLTLRSADGSVRCGGRFKYIAPEIDFSYDALTNALNQAIDKEAAETNNQFVTDERQTAPVIKEYDYDALMEEFQTMVGKLMEGASGTANGPKITQIIEKYLGKGKKISETTRDQAEFIYLIVTEIKEDLM
jgi:hypothetical protein